MLRTVLLAFALMAMSPLAVQAQYGGWNRYGDSREYAAQREEQGKPPARQREAGRESNRRNTLSPDEQRELNRDLRRADREIYRKGRERSRRD